ncbi:MAG: YARHG domain-containing protein [Spirochaetes bacterium]|nr:YARHG domain-containing protein [Spirochaetota bacterium]
MYRLTALIILVIAAFVSGKTLYLEKNQAVDPASWSGSSIEDLILARNAVFARYGYVFKSGALNRHFLSVGWYRPDRNFSYSMLTKIDQRNVNAILAAEKKKVGELKNRIAGTAVKTKRYFMAAGVKERVPASAEEEMRKWWKKKSGSLYPQLRVPVLLGVSLSDEKDAAYISGRTGNCRDSFSYWEAGYDDRGRLRVLKNYFCEQGGSGESGDIYYFDEKEKLLMVQGRILGTTVNYEYYYQYCLGSVVWIEVTLINGSAGIPDEMEKFFF